MKLTEIQITQIKVLRRDEHIPIRERSINALAARFNVTPSTIQYHTNENYRAMKNRNSKKWQRENPDKHKINVQRSRDRLTA